MNEALWNMINRIYFAILYENTPFTCLTEVHSVTMAEVAQLHE